MKNKRIILAIAVALVVLFSVNYIRFFTVRPAIQSSKALAIDHLEVTFAGVQKNQHLILSDEDALYSQLSSLLSGLHYIPDPFAGSRTQESGSGEILLRYGTNPDGTVLLYITISETGACQINGKCVLVLSARSSNKQLYQKLLELFSDESVPNYF